ncbi:hypothetical protein R83H12_00658 [Fibrobacteria bacterium R8-3-H12]
MNLKELSKEDLKEINEIKKDTLYISVFCICLVFFACISISKCVGGL